MNLGERGMAKVDALLHVAEGGCWFFHVPWSLDKADST